MSQIRELLAFGLAAGSAAPQSAFALTVQEAIALAQRANPVLAQAKAQTDAAMAQAGGARALLAAQTAEAYVAVLAGREILALNEAQVRQMGEIAGQA